MSANNEVPKLLWRVDELARATSCSRSYIYKLIEAGQIKTVHVGRSCRITQVEVERFVESLS